MQKTAGIIGGTAVTKQAMTAMDTSFEENPLLEVIDMHVHSGPDVRRRSVNDIELAVKGREAGLRGVVIYNHNFITHDRAYLIRQVVPGIEMFGGIALNYPVGGCNPAAVEMALKFTGNCMKYVKLPSQAAANDLAKQAKEGHTGGLMVIDHSGKVLPEVRKILSMMAKADLLLLTGHISPKEDLAVIKAAKEEGVKKMMITHAMSEITNVSMGDMKKLVGMGAIIEHCSLNYFQKQITIERYAKTIKELGAENCVISSDLGQALNPVPTEGLREFIVLLMKQGISTAEMAFMTKKNPARLLGLELF